MFGGLELLPQLLAVGASLEGSHAVHLTRNQDHVQIVLSHHCGRAGSLTGIANPLLAKFPHQHGTAARLFCLFAERTPARPDHVASFSASALCDDRGPSLVAKTKSPDAACSALTPPGDFHYAQYYTPNFTGLTLIRARAQTGPSLLRSIVLLI